MWVGAGDDMRREISDTGTHIETNRQPIHDPLTEVMGQYHNVHLIQAPEWRVTFFHSYVKPSDQ
jgi:hypothetical protein